MRGTEAVGIPAVMSEKNKVVLNVRQVLYLRIQRQEIETFDSPDQMVAILKNESAFADA